jgi:hypothetical protein
MSLERAGERGSARSTCYSTPHEASHLFAPSDDVVCHHRLFVIDVWEWQRHGRRRHCAQRQRHDHDELHGLLQEGHWMQSSADRHAVRRRVRRIDRGVQGMRDSAGLQRTGERLPCMFVGGVVGRSDDLRDFHAMQHDDRLPGRAPLQRKSEALLSLRCKLRWPTLRRRHGLPDGRELQQRHQHLQLSASPTP